MTDFDVPNITRLNLSSRSDDGEGEEDEGDAIFILLDGYDTMGIGYMALWGFRAKCGTGVDGWMDGYPLDCYDY